MYLLPFNMFLVGPRGKSPHYHAAPQGSLDRTSNDCGIIIYPTGLLSCSYVPGAARRYFYITAVIRAVKAAAPSWVL